ncbi:hypothetical protein COBT_001040 [Conglomerata obtusa]
MLFWMMCLILSINHLFACFSKHPIDTGNYVITRKWKDYNYMRQAEKLANCLDALPEEIYAKKAELKLFWTERAFKQATKALDPRDLERIHARRFIECFELVAENKAGLFLCPVLPNEDSHKFINKYTLLEYEECIRQKNDPYIKSFDLKLPNVGFGSISQNHIE